jgi:hypothetical protein
LIHDEESGTRGSILFLEQTKKKGEELLKG